METQVVEYDITKAAIKEMSNKFMPLCINGLDDTEGFEAVHNARMVVKGKRIEVEKRRKELKADALAWGKKVDSEAKKIFQLLKPIEDHLKAEEDSIVNEKKRLEEEKAALEQLRIQKRIDNFAKYGTTISYFDAAAMSDDEYSTALEKLKDEYRAEQVRIAKEKRLEEERIAREEEARKAEDERLRKERAELERIKAEQEEAQRKIDAEKKLIEEQKRKEEERLYRIEVEKQAKIEAEARAKQVAEQAEKDKIAKQKAEEERKAKEEALLPDKEKLLLFIDKLRAVKNPEISVPEAQILLKDFMATLDSLFSELLVNFEKLENRIMEK